MHVYYILADACILYTHRCMYIIYSPMQRFAEINCKTAFKFNFAQRITILLLLLLLLLLKEVGSARLRVSDVNPISPKTTAPQYQPLDKKKRKGKIVDPASPTPSNTRSGRSLNQRDTEMGIKVPRYLFIYLFI